jgi:predicted dehydrogenase
MKKALRVGCMGAGWPSHQHAGSLAKIGGVELAAVCDPDVERRRKFLETHGRMQEYDDYRDMLRNAELDAAVVSLPTGMHCEAAVAALDQGLHVLCEKPPTRNVSEMLQVARLAKRKRLTYMFCRQPRYSAASLEARRLVQSGRIGQVYHAEGSWIRARNIPWGAGGWFVNKKKGGGVLLDLGVHAIDNAWFVMGCPRPVEVVGGLHCAFAPLAPKGVEYTAEDAAVGLVRFEDGATLQFMVTFALNTAGPDAKNAKGLIKPEWTEVRVYGTQGGIDVSAGKLILGREKEVEVQPLKKLRKVEPDFLLQAREFVRAVRAHDEPLNSASQAVMLMQMLEALRKSGENRRAERIRPAKI